MHSISYVGIETNIWRPKSVDFKLDNNKKFIFEKELLFHKMKTLFTINNNSDSINNNFLS